MNGRLTLLILGGYGVFGGRLTELLSDTDTTIIIAGRTYNKAVEFCDTCSGTANFIPLLIDRNNIEPALKKYTPDIVIDATGPFQDYGENPYSVLQTCIDYKINYLDFADGADFVYGISKFDAAAKDAGIFMLSGVSSFPVLSAAVLREMEKTMTIENVIGGIAPSPYAGIGLNVMRAVIGYAGGPVKLTRNGKQHIAKGLTESLYYTVSPPGQLPLRNLRYSLVDVPDLQALPVEHSSIQNIWIGAGPIPECLHRLLNFLAKARAQYNFPSFSKFSKLFYWVLNLMKFGEHRGGMFMEASGKMNGSDAKQSWHLLAEGDDGPYIPSMAIEIIIRKYLEGKKPAIGARPAVSELELSDYTAIFENRTIKTGWRNDPKPDATLYEKILNTVYQDLPKQVQKLHGSNDTRRWSGFAKTTGGNTMLARLIAKLVGFPQDNANLPITVTFTPSGTGELWERNFDGKKFRSYQDIGSGRNSRLLTEKFGIITVALAVLVQDDRLYLQPRRWSCLGIPLPKRLLPKGNSYETEEDGKFHFNVRVEAPIVGLIAAYQGWLEPNT